MEQKPNAQLVQQKIKRMIQTRKRITSKQTPVTLKRLQSNIDNDQINQPQAQEAQQNKPKSSIIRVRPRTSQKNKSEQTNSQTTDSSSKNDIDVKTLIDTAFNHGFQLAKYLNKNNLNPEDSKSKLLQNDIFNTFLLSKLSKAQEENYQHIAEKQIICKLQKMALIEQQQKNCLFIQDKISLLIEQKLKSLSKS